MDREQPSTGGEVVLEVILYRLALSDLKFNKKQPTNQLPSQPSTHPVIYLVISQPNQI